MRLQNKAFGLTANKKKLKLIKSNTFFVLFICSVLLVPGIALTADEKFDRASTNPEDYRIGPEDVLDISVWKEEELQREVLVRPDGGISFPLAGDVLVEGKDTIRSRTGNYHENPEIYP